MRHTAAMTGEEAFADGNRLFRDDLYWAALLRYREAAEAGVDTPALHFNTGVAHYRAHQHIRARQSLLRAAQAPALRVISHYNLGLNAFAAGDLDEARDWFRQARDQEEDPQIRQLAIIALSRLRTEELATDTLLARVERRREEPELTSLQFRGQVGFGSDNNVFRTPSRPYVDFADPTLPIVSPQEASGAYMPVDLDLRYSLNSFPFEWFYVGYRLAGRFYQDKELENGNEVSHEVRVGSEYSREENGRSRRVTSAFTFAQHQETYFDPDDGLAREINGEPVDGRLDYTRWGPQIAFRQGFDKFDIGLYLKGQLWNYEKAGELPEYDHEYFEVGGILQYRFTPTALVRLTLEKSSRIFGDRPSFELDGSQAITNPAVRYDYLEAGVTARQRVGDSMWFGFGYRHTERSDRYVGYNDFSREQFEIDFRWRAAGRLQLEAGGYYRIYDFPNAYAFHNPVAGPKTLESLGAHALVSYAISRSLSIDLKAQSYEAVSTDARIQYDRVHYSLGVTWQR